jgi:hypothetical protein
MKTNTSFKQLYNDEEFMFKLSTGLKFVFISLGFTFSVLLFTYLLMKIDLIYFVAHGYPGAQEFQVAFYDFIYSSLIDEIPYAIFAGIFIFCLGYYLSAIMIRPFKVLGKYCEERFTSNQANYYSPDYFSDLKLLTSFSVFFFSHIDDAKTRGKLEKIEVPLDYTRIHKPVFEKNFFFNYLFIIIIFALLASVGILVINNTIREQIFLLSQKFLRNSAGGGTVRYFIEEQFSVADIAVYFFLTLHALTYCVFGLHLYGKISGPAFAIFATMRSFLRGNYHNRVHLIGHYYLRDDCRKINKYLDYVQKNLTKDI